VITQLTLLKDSSPLVHIKNTNQTTRTEGVKVQFLTPFKKRDHDSWGFVPEVKRLISYVQLAQNQTQVGCHIQNFVDKWKQVTSDPWVLKIVEEGLRLKFVSNPPKSGVRKTNLFNIVHMSDILEMVKKNIRKRCYRISTTRSGRPGF
jgi:hypothetical protein